MKIFLNKFDVIFRLKRFLIDIESKILTTLQTHTKLLMEIYCASLIKFAGKS